MLTIRARHFATHEAIDVDIQGPSIAAIRPADVSESESNQLPYISPGFFDIQINGYNGVWFSSRNLTVEQVINTTQSLVDKGIARFFPTLITASFAALHHGFTTLRQAAEASALVSNCVEGYHLEGPYISAEDGPRGAHPVEHVRGADYDEFQKLQSASGGRIRLVTLAAEVAGAVDFIRQCCHDGVIVALGHTGATPEQIRAAVDAGAQLSTHFGNGAHATLPRHPNYLWEQLADDRLYASVIADGWHVPASVLKCVLKCKSNNRTILTCDVSGFAGCPPGTYSEGDVDVEVLTDGRLVVAGQRQFLAGSGAIIGDCIVHMASKCEIPLADAVAMATANPDRLLRQEPASLKVGQPATLSVFHVNENPSEGPTFASVGTYVHGSLLSKVSDS